MQTPSHTIPGALAGMHRHFRVSNAEEIPHGNYFSYALTQCQEASYYIKKTLVTIGVGFPYYLFPGHS